MRTLKISLVATAAATAAWLFHLPQKTWPEHPYFVDFLMALVLCLILQYTWMDSRPESKAKTTAS